MIRRLWVLSTALLVGACGGGGGGGGSSTPTNPPNPPAGTRTLFVSVQPSGAVAGKAFSTQPVVHVRTAQGARDTADDSTVVSVALVAFTAAPSAQLTGTTSVTVQDGIATFTDLAINSAGTGYRLRFTASGLTAVDSDAFDVAAATDPDPDPDPDADVTFEIDSQQDVKPISRFIYGMNFGFGDDEPKNLTLSRSGGNRMTAYNWETNASNAGADWFHQNDSFLGGGEVPGGAVTPLIDAALDANAGVIVTVPMIGYVAADKNGGGDVGQSGADYLDVRFHRSLPRKPGGAFQTTPDTSDKFVYQDEWVNFLDVKYPGAISSDTTPIFFSLDNEPDLWYATHARLRNERFGAEGEKVTYAELVSLTIDYASAIKDVNPNAVVFGPVNYGWQGMVRLQDAPDANNRDFLNFYLQEMAEEDQSQGRRLLDVLDVHWYPEAQGGGVRITGEETSAAVVEARKQAPRSLWDPTYTEESWITQWSTGGPITLLPRLQNKIDTHYPGTRLAITEYSYGGGAHISGGIAQADVLGIFGRYEVFAATMWRLAQDQRFIYGAFDMFRNFDGNNGSFGDTSIRATTSDIETTSVYASVDDGDADRMVIVCINKANSPQIAAISINHPVAFGTARVFTLTNASATPQRRDDIAVGTSNTLTYTMPANSVTTLELVP